jgi:hypothetical protein
MRKWYGITAFLLFFQTVTNAQLFKSLRYEIEGGTGISVGRSTSSTIESDINPIALQHFVHKRYKYPSLRLRGYVYKPLTRVMNLGLKAGMDVHYMETDLFDVYRSTLTFPIQLFGELELMPINKVRALFLAAGIGSNLKWLKFGPFTEKSGLLVSGEAIIKIPSQSNSFFYKAGFEYGVEHCSYHYIPGNTPGTEELIKYRQHRKQLYIVVGLKF